MKIRANIIHDVYVVLAQARCVNLPTEDKINISHVARVLKPIALKFESDSSDIAEKMKTSDDLFERYKKALQYEQMLKKPDCDPAKLPFGPAENAAFWLEWKQYNKDVEKAMTEISCEEHELSIKGVSEDTFKRLVEANPNWTIGQIEAVGEIVTANAEANPEIVSET